MLVRKDWWMNADNCYFETKLYFSKVENKFLHFCCRAFRGTLFSLYLISRAWIYTRDKIHLQVKNMRIDFPPIFDRLMNYDSNNPKIHLSNLKIFLRYIAVQSWIDKFCCDTTTSYSISLLVTDLLLFLNIFFKKWFILYQQYRDLLLKGKCFKIL